MHYQLRLLLCFYGCFRKAGRRSAVCTKELFQKSCRFHICGGDTDKAERLFSAAEKKQHRRTADTLGMRNARNTLQLLCGRPSGIIRCGNAEQNVAVLRYRIFGTVSSGADEFSADVRCNSRICRKSAYNKAKPCKSGTCAVTARFPRRYGRRCGLYGGKVARHQRRKRTLYRVLLLGLLLPCNIAVFTVRFSRYDLAAVARTARCRTCGGRRSVQHHGGI